MDKAKEQEIHNPWRRVTFFRSSGIMEDLITIDKILSEANPDGPKPTDRDLIKNYNKVGEWIWLATAPPVEENSGGVGTSEGESGESTILYGSAITAAVLEMKERD